MFFRIYPDFFQGFCRIFRLLSRLLGRFLTILGTFSRFDRIFWNFSKFFRTFLGFCVLNSRFSSLTFGNSWGTYEIVFKALYISFCEIYFEEIFRILGWAAPSLSRQPCVTLIFLFS
jgi:hypothetical protein